MMSEEIALSYLDQLPWPPYPFQEQAILSWFDSEDGILVCAPTGTGKTVIAETALYEAMMTGRKAYYTTPLIALTEQKFHELQDSAERWGFPRESVGLVTGNRRVNPEAPILVVVAEILLNRLLSPDEFAFDDVSAVVMDEFHSFNDPERGIVWELSLGMLPKTTRVLLISATVGNAPEFVMWLHRQHNRTLRLLQSDERKVPLSFRWIPDELLPDQLEIMADGDDSSRYTPALVFCFNRSECWNVADQLKGKRLLAEGQQKQLQQELDRLDLTVGAGGRLKQILIRGVGIHHAGLLPKYRRIVETLFQKKLLSVCVCTETLAAGINLPARSVVMTSLLKGPPGNMKLIDASSAHQMFGRAGRPQFDDKGFVFTVAHEDDVRLFRWQQRYDQIPEDTKDPLLLKAKKNLKKKMPRRRPGQQYWSEKQFESLQQAPPAKLASRGRFPWRLLAYLIRKSTSVAALQDAIRRRLLQPDEKQDAERSLKRMLITLDSCGFVHLSPRPPNLTVEFESSGEVSTTTSPDDASRDTVFRSRTAGTGIELEIDSVQDGRSATTSVWGKNLQQQNDGLSDVVDFSAVEQEVSEDFAFGIFDDEEEETNSDSSGPEDVTQETATSGESGDDSPDTEFSDAKSSDADESTAESVLPGQGLLGQLIQEARRSGEVVSTAATTARTSPKSDKSRRGSAGQQRYEIEQYEPIEVKATDSLEILFAFRSINSIHAAFVAEHFHRASYEERLQLLEASLDMPGSVAKYVRVPFPEDMPPGPLATDFLNGELISRGIVTQDAITGYRDEATGRRVPPLTLAGKMDLLFRNEFPGVHDARSTPVWCIGDLLCFGGDFNKYVRARDLTKHEGIIFRHCLRMILLCGEFAQIEPPDIPPSAWRRDLAELAALLTDACRAVDPDSTDETLVALESRKLDPEQLVL